MASVDCFGVLYGHRCRLDTVLPPLSKLSCNSTSTEQIFGRPVSINGVDSFGLLHGNRRLLDSVLPPLSCHSMILTLLPPRTSNPSPSIPERDRLQLPSKLTAFVCRVRKVLLGRPKPQELPEKVPSIARPSPELVLEQQELPSKAPYVGMPSDKLVVIQILRCNYQRQHGGNKPSQLEERYKTQSGSPKPAVLPVFKHLIFNKEKFDDEASATLDEFQGQVLETTDALKTSDEVTSEANSSALDEASGGDSANNNEEYGKELSKSFGSDALSNEKNVAHQIDNDNTLNESEEDRKDRNDSSKSDGPSTNENGAHQVEIEDGATANTSEGKGDNGSHCSPSDGLSGKETAAAQHIEDNVTAYNSQGKREDGSDCLSSDVMSDKQNAVGQDIDEKLTANGIKGKEKDCRERPTSDTLPSKSTSDGVEDSDTAGNGEGDGEACSDPSKNDALSETSSAYESDGGVPISNCQEGWKDGSNRSTSDELSAEDHQRDDGDAVEDSKKERKNSTDSPASDYLTADESIQAEDASDEVEVDAGDNRILDDDSPLLPSEQDYRSGSENEAAVDGTDDDSVDTNTENENSIPSIWPSSRSRLQYPSNKYEDTRDHDGDIENSRISSDSSPESSVDEGPWVMGVDRHGGIEAHRVSPVPFDVCQLRESENTPSIKSRGSELDDTSPLFQKSSAPVKKRAYPDQPPLSTSGEAASVRKPETSLNVWRDDSSDAKSGGKPRLRRKPGMVFKDVSNSRQLLRNVQGTEIDQDPVKESKGIDRTRNDAKRTPHVLTSKPYLPPHLTSSYIENRQPEKDASVSMWAPARDPVRAAHFAATLAALEGKVYPKPGTPAPLIRCARQEYGPDVLLDWSTAPLFHPKPMRPWIGEKTIENLEKQVASAKWMRSSAEMKPQTMRPSNPTPYAARYHHMDIYRVTGEKDVRRELF